MKTLLITLIALLAACAYAEIPEVRTISIFTGAWLIDFESDGSASAQYGSTPGDSGNVDKGTIDFNALLEVISKTDRKDTKETSDRFQVSTRYEGQTSTTGYTLVDDSYIEMTLQGLEGKWKPLGQRFLELKAKYPIIPKKISGSEQSVPGYPPQGVGSPEP